MGILACLVGLVAIVLIRLSHSVEPERDRVFPETPVIDTDMAGRLSDVLVI